MKQSEEKFLEALAAGRKAELLVARWLQQRGWGIIPCYDYSGKEDQKTPRLQFASNGVVIPDLDACKGGKRVWVEVKFYHGPAFNRQLKSNVHGIPKRLYDHYTTTRKESGSGVMIVIVERDSRALLAANLMALRVYPCQCGACVSGGYCYAPIRCGVYWKRDDMQHLHTFAEKEVEF